MKVPVQADQTRLIWSSQSAKFPTYRSQRIWRLFVAAIWGLGEEVDLCDEERGRYQPEHVWSLYCSAEKSGGDRYQSGRDSQKVAGEEWTSADREK